MFKELLIATLLFSSAGALSERSGREVQQKPLWCPNDDRWHWFGQTSSCFFVSRESDARSHGSSVEACNEWGARLASINNKEENDFIASIIEPDQYYYIGLTGVVLQAETETLSDGQWIDGSSSTYRNWDADQLYCTAYSLQCDGTWISGDGLWTAATATWMTPYICKLTQP